MLKMNISDHNYNDHLWPTVWFVCGMAAIMVLSVFMPPFKLIDGIAAYAPLHTFFETVSIIASMLVFSICWNVHAKERSGNFILLGCVFLGVAILDFLHLLSYPGMPDFITPNTTEKAIDLWLAARALAALGLLSVALLPWRLLRSEEIRWWGLVATILLVVIVAWIGLFYQEFTPATFVEGQGLTIFKIMSEYALIALYIGAALRFFLNMRIPQPYDVVSLFAAAILMAMSEVFFTLYATVNDVFNILGHVYKVVAYIFLYKGIFFDSINVPYQRLNMTKEALQTSEERFSISQKFSNVGTFEWNISTNKSIWSEQMWPILGLTPRCVEPEFDVFMEYVNPDDREALTIAITHSVERGGDVDIEFRLIWPDNSIHWVRGRGNVVRNDNGKPIRMLGVLIDIDSIKEAENERWELFQQLQQAQKMESIGHLTGGIAHNFNNILSAVLGFNQLSMRDPSVDPGGKLAKYLLEVQHAGERGRDLVVEMLAFGRSSPGKQQAVDGAALITNVTKLLSPTLPSSLIVDVNITDEVQPLLGNSEQLHHVITNLIINAYHAIGESGNIDLNLSGPHHIDSVCDSCHHPFSGDFIEISVRDNGHGIPADKLDHVFDPFFTTKEVGKGSGMGLSMVHGILHQCGAHILVETEQGVGTNFRLFFQPAFTETPEIVENKIVLPASRIENKCVMVVDDEEGITGYLTELLNNWGYQVCAYNDPLVALAAFKADPSSIDLVITDQTMPNLTGAKLAQRLLLLCPSLPVILCTGYSENIDKKGSQHLGIAAFLKKPVDSEELLSFIAKFIT